LAGEGHGQ